MCTTPITPTREATPTLGEDAAMIRHMHLLVKAETKRVHKEFLALQVRMQQKKRAIFVEMAAMGFEFDSTKKYIEDEMRPCREYARQLYDYRCCLSSKLCDLLKQMSWLGIQPHEVELPRESASSSGLNVGEFGPNNKRMKKSSQEDFEEALDQWFMQAHSQSMEISSPILFEILQEPELELAR